MIPLKYTAISGFLLGLLLLSGGHLLAQKQLSLQKNRGGSIKYFEGDFLKVRSQVDGRWIAGELEHIGQDTVVVAGYKLALVEIDAVQHQRDFLRVNGYLLATAGVLWPGIVVVNGLLANARPLLTPGAAIGSVVMLGGGIALTQLGKRTYRMKNGHRLLITEFKNLAPQTD